MSSLAMRTTVEQQIVLHQFTPRHSIQARAMLGWSPEEFARKAGVQAHTIQCYESHGAVADEIRLTLALCLEAWGLVFFPGFAPGWGMNRRRSVVACAEPTSKGMISRFLDPATALTEPTAPQPSGA